MFIIYNNLKKPMKKTLVIAIFLFAALFVIQGITKAQNLYFCEGVSKDGQPETPSSTFSIPSSGGYFYFLVRLPYGVVDYVLYKNDSRGNPKYYTTITQDALGTDWTWFWKKVTFTDVGDFRIDVVDCTSATLVSNYVTVKYQ
jgi:hypothetical protein